MLYLKERPNRMIRADFCCPSAKAVIIKLLSHSGCLNFYGEPLASEPAEVDWKRLTGRVLLWKEDARRDADRRWGQHEEAAEAREDIADIADLHKHISHSIICSFSARISFTSRICHEIFSSSSCSLSYFFYRLLCCQDE